MKFVLFRLTERASCKSVGKGGFHLTSHINLLLVFCAFGISFVLTPLLRKLSVWAQAYAHENKRTIHHGKISRIGGIAMYVSSTCCIALFITPDQSVRGIFYASSLVFFTGLIDDLYDLKPWLKMGMEVLAALILIHFGVQAGTIHLPFGISIDNPTISVLFTIVWVVGITNAVNLFDGLDGLAGGVCLMVFVMIMSISLVDRRYDIFNLAMIYAVSIAGFLIYNAHPASIFMGDCGALYLGFVIASISLLGFKSSTILTLALPILLLILPIIDTFSAIVRRRIKGISFAEADRYHMHHQMLRLFGHKNAVILLCGLTFAFGMCGFLYIYNQKLGLLAILSLLFAVELLIESTGMISEHYHPFLSLAHWLAKPWRALKNKNAWANQTSEQNTRNNPEGVFADLPAETLKDPSTQTFKAQASLSFQLEESEELEEIFESGDTGSFWHRLFLREEDSKKGTASRKDKLSWNPEEYEEHLMREAAILAGFAAEDSRTPENLIRQTDDPAAKDLAAEDSDIRRSNGSLSRQLSELLPAGYQPERTEPPAQTQADEPDLNFSVPTISPVPGQDAWYYETGRHSKADPSRFQGKASLFVLKRADELSEIQNPKADREQMQKTLRMHNFHHPAAALFEEVSLDTIAPDSQMADQGPFKSHPGSDKSFESASRTKVQTSSPAKAKRHLEAPQPNDQAELLPDPLYGEDLNLQTRKFHPQTPSRFPSRKDAGKTPDSKTRQQADSKIPMMHPDPDAKDTETAKNQTEQKNAVLSPQPGSGKPESQSSSTSAEAWNAQQPAFHPCSPLQQTLLEHLQQHPLGALADSLQCPEASKTASEKTSPEMTSSEETSPAEPSQRAASRPIFSEQLHKNRNAR